MQDESLELYRERLENQKPPVGLKPRWLYEQERVFEICRAVSRYSDACCSVPIEWIEELNELTAKMLGNNVGLPWEVPDEC